MASVESGATTPTLRNFLLIAVFAVISPQRVGNDWDSSLEKIITLNSLALNIRVPPNMICKYSSKVPQRTVISRNYVSVTIGLGRM